MDNKMSSVADLLGLELGEVFRINGCSGYAHYPKTYLKFTENGLIESVDKKSWHSAAAWLWKNLIKGTLEITKLPWKPSHYNEVYYLPSIISIGKNIKLFWTGSEADKSSYQQGLICRTEEEAIKLAEEMLDIARKRFAGDR